MDMKYAGFWPRTLAVLIDALVVGPLFGLQIFVSQRFSPAIAIASFLALGGLGQAYPVYFHARWGQTVGKMAANIKVVQLDGTAIAPRHALLRSSVDLVMFLTYSIPTVFVLATWNGPEWSSLSWIQQSRLIGESNPFFDIYSWVAQAWTWSEIVVLLFNKRRRALHDFIAGTVVIKTSQHVDMPEAGAR